MKKFLILSASVAASAAAAASVDRPLTVESSQTVLIHLAGNPPRQTIDFQGKTYRSKDELHVTVIGFKTKKELSRSVPPARLGEMMRQAAEGVQVKLTPVDDFRHVVDGEKESLIELVDVSGLEVFYARLEGLLGLESGAIPRAPTHVTLFTEETGDPLGQGIGIESQSDMDAWSTILDAQDATPISRYAAQAWSSL